MTDIDPIPQMENLLNPQDFVITRKRKLYKFAHFHNSPLCYESENWNNNPEANVLEIGAGTGSFSVELAKSDSARQYVAIDVKADRLQTGARRAGEEKLSNIRFLRARADQLLDLITPNSLDAIWVTFPDPRPKKRSAKNRLLHPRFLDVYKTLLKDGGSLHFKTDARELFNWSLEQLVDHGWAITELSFDLHESRLSDSYKIKTNYETRYMNQGIAINFVSALPKQN